MRASIEEDLLKNLYVSLLFADANSSKKKSLTLFLDVIRYYRNIHTNELL